MSSQGFQTPRASRRRAEPYVPVEDVAQRLGIPLAILLRRIEAGDVPAQRVSGSEGMSWRVRLSDLGVEPAASENGSEPEVVDADTAEAGTPAQPEVIIASEQAEESAAVERAAPAGAVQPDRKGAQRGIARLRDAPLEVREQVAGLRIDPHELVSGLLDRWERTLEQRIYAEQRQRFENELVTRQTLVKQLQLELQAARAEHAALQAERDRRMADLERRIWDMQRELDTAHAALEKKQRRGLFRRR